MSAIARLSVVASLVSVASACRSTSLPRPPPPLEIPPPDFGPTGILIEQPRDGETLTGKWVAVTGWVDPKRAGAVLVMGGPDPAFNVGSGGHMPVATAEIVIRKDGRFVAPRVPLVEGKTEIRVVGLKGGDHEASTQTITVTGVHTEVVPATVVAEPEMGNAPLSTTLRAYAASGGGDWEWDFDGDGLIDGVANDGVAVKRSYASAGTKRPMARRKQDGRWVYGVGRVAAAADPAVIAEAVADAPAAIFVVPDDARRWEMLKARPLDLEHRVPDLEAGIRSVLVADGDVVKVFDPKLNLKATLTGFSGPKGVVGDELGHVFVADTGNDRVVAVNDDGTPATGFGAGGVISGTDDLPFKRPTMMAMGWTEQDVKGTRVRTARFAVIDAGNRRLVECGQRPRSTWGCQTASVKLLTAFKPAVPPMSEPALLGTLVSDGRDGQCCDRLMPAVLGDSGRLFSGEENRYHQFAKPRQVLVALTAMIFFNDTWSMAADSDGTLHEWQISNEIVSEDRQTRMPFKVTALAVDDWASHVSWRNPKFKPPGTEDWKLGPFVVYVGGPGRIQRRIFTQLVPAR